MLYACQHGTNALFQRSKELRSSAQYWHHKMGFLCSNLEVSKLAGQLKLLLQPGQIGSSLLPPPERHYHREADLKQLGWSAVGRCLVQYHSGESRNKMKLGMILTVMQSIRQTHRSSKCRSNVYIFENGRWEKAQKHFKVWRQCLWGSWGSVCWMYQRQSWVRASLP